MTLEHRKNLDVFNVDSIDDAIGFEEYFPNILAFKFRNLTAHSGIASSLVCLLFQFCCPLSGCSTIIFGYETAYLK